MPDYLTVEEVSDILGFHVDSVRRLIRGEKLSADKKAGVWLIPRGALEEYQKALEGRSKHDPWRPGGREKGNETANSGGQ
jgi:excisionase family DNA binding protein